MSIPMKPRVRDHSTPLHGKTTQDRPGGHKIKAAVIFRQDVRPLLPVNVHRPGCPFLHDPAALAIHIHLVYLHLGACYFPIEIWDNPRLHMKFKPQHQWRVLEMRMSSGSLITAYLELDRFTAENLRLPCGRRNMFV